jgi:hypothetical protein
MKKTTTIAQLPDDVQVLVWDMALASQPNRVLYRLGRHRFLIRWLPLKAFPSIPIGTDYRNEEYAQSMMYADLPPIIMCRNRLLDGRHRIWVSRRAGQDEISAIDLADIGFLCDFAPICTANYHRRRPIR